MVTWMDCILQICKGISWSIVIWSIFLAASWFMGSITKDIVDKAKNRIAPKEE
jgi:hypothetical protein